MAASTKNSKKGKDIIAKSPGVSSNLTFVLYNWINTQPIDAKISEILNASGSNYFFIKKEDSFQLLDKDLKTTEISSVVLSNLVVFVNIEQINAVSEIDAWLKIDKKTAYLKPVHLYSNLRNFKGLKSDSIGLSKVLASSLLNEATLHPAAYGLLDFRLKSFSYQSNYILLNEVPDSKPIPKENIYSKTRQFGINFFSSPVALSKTLYKGVELKFEHPLFKPVFALLLIFGFIYLLIGSQHIGINSDEYRYIGQAEKVINFYTSWGKDTAACIPTGIDAMHYNIQIVDNFLYGVGKLFGWEYNFSFRHFMVACICWFSILFAGLIALRLSGYKLASITVFMLICSPIFIGNGFNNERDFITVIGLNLAIFGLLSSGFVFPVIRLSHLCSVFLGIFLIGGQRVAGGILALAFLGLLSLAILYVHKKLNFSLWRNLHVRRWIIGILITCALAYISTILIWPFGLINPVKHILEAIKFSNKVTVGMNQVFEGKLQLSTNMPPHYLIKYLLITIPAAVWLGLLLTIILFRRLKIIIPYLLVITFIFVFTVTYAYLKLSTMYGSWRQFTLIYPFIVIFSAVGWNTFFDQIPKLRNSLMTLGVLVVALIHPIQYSIRNHPFEYLYYNEFVGGPSGAYSNYEWDYAFNSLKQGSDWLKDYIQKNHLKGTKVVIATNGVKEVTKYFEGFDTSVTVNYTRYYERYTNNWDYAIFPNAYIHPFQLKNHVFSRLDSLHFIKVDGEPVCFIYKRNNREDFAAAQAISSNNSSLAVEKLNAYLKHYPRSEWAWFQLGYVFLRNGNYAQAQSYINECFKHQPEFAPARAAQALIYMNTNRPKEAQPILAKLIKEKYDLANSYNWSGMTYEAQKNYRKALEQYGFALGAGNKEKATYQNIANCFRQLGDLAQAAKYDAMAK